MEGRGLGLLWPGITHYGVMTSRPEGVGELKAGDSGSYRPGY